MQIYYFAAFRQPLKRLTICYTSTRVNKTLEHSALRLDLIRTNTTYLNSTQVHLLSFTIFVEEKQLAGVRLFLQPNLVYCVCFRSTNLVHRTNCILTCIGIGACLCFFVYFYAAQQLIYQCQMDRAGGMREAIE